jgi:hypothetical protein
MAARRVKLPARQDAEVILTAVAATVGTLALALFGVRRLGTIGLFAPLAIVLVVILLRRPVAAVAFTVALAVLFEGPSFGVSFTAELYKQFYKGLTPLDVVVVLAILAVGIDILRHRRAPRLPPVLALPLALVALAMTAGFWVGHDAGASLRDAAISLHVLLYLLLIPAAIVNLDLSRERATLLLRGGLVLAILKAMLGLIALIAGMSVEVDVGTTLTYYEPTANWIIMIAALGVIAAMAGGARPPRGLLLVGLPLLIASLVLSYRRSFWIASVLGLLLVLLLATSARGRRMLPLGALLVVAGVWVLGSVQFQAQTPLAKRVQSLNPTKLQATAEDRYRLDERANVIAEIRRHPIAGLGTTIPWVATARSLPVEHVDGRLYVHFALLWWWLKLGILGAAAYVSLLVSGILLGWRTWRRNDARLPRSFGIASVCGFVGLLVIETTASFTGVDPRFTILFGAQLGLLAVLAQGPRGVV